MQAAEAQYPILSIQPNWVLEEEAMGSKLKFWFRRDGHAAWLFKYPQRNTGQHWAEKIAAEIAGALEILHAKVDFAAFDGVWGSATESFAREGLHVLQMKYEALTIVIRLSRLLFLECLATQ